jgi:C4-dicarboxylate-specific signal transduction histidine kinase
MKNTALFSFIAAAALALCAVSCKKSSQTDATQPLQQSFQTAEPEVKTAIDTVTTNLRAQNYAGATRALAPVITRPLTDQQKQAVGVALKQINDAVAANPALDTKEMYEMRAKMFQAVHRGPRF